MFLRDPGLPGVAVVLGASAVALGKAGDPGANRPGRSGNETPSWMQPNSHPMPIVEFL